MPISQSASNSPTPSSTSRVIMTGLIGPDLRREDCWSGPSHDDWRKTCLMESCRWNPAEKLGISHGRSSKDGYHIYRVPPTILWSFPEKFTVKRETLAGSLSLSISCGRARTDRNITD